MNTISCPKEAMRDDMQRYRTLSLFYEYKNDRYPYLYTLNVEDKYGVPSLYKIYMSYIHVPGEEYEFANDHLLGWKHWQRICANAYLLEHITEWRAEMDIKLRSMAIKNIIASSLSDTPTALQAAKWLAEKGYDLKRGRPSKAEKEGWLKQEAKLKDVVEEDMERVGLSLVK